MLQVGVIGMQPEQTTANAARVEPEEGPEPSAERNHGAASHGKDRIGSESPSDGRDRERERETTIDYRHHNE